MHFGLAMLLMTSSLLLLYAPAATAGDGIVNNRVWTGDGGNSNFNTPENWAGDIRPDDDDRLVFNVSGQSLELNNNWLSTIGSIRVNAAEDSGSVSIASNAFAVTISDVIEVGDGQSLTMAGSQPYTLTAGNAYSLEINSNLDFASTAGTSITSGTLTIDSNFVPSVGGDIEPVPHIGFTSLTDSAGSILALNKAYLVINEDSSTYAGSINAVDAIVEIKHANALGTSAGGVSLLRSILSTQISDDFTIEDDITINGNLFGASMEYTLQDLESSIYAAFIVTSSGAPTLSGEVTLLSDVVASAPIGGDISFTGPLSGNHIIVPAPAEDGTVIINTAQNSSYMPNGTYKTVSGTITDSSSQSVVVSPGVTLVINGSRGNAVVAPGSTLKGTGTVGKLRVVSSGRLAPGTSPGCLNSGDLNLVSGANFDAELAGNTACSLYDQLRVTGSVSLGGASLNLSLLNGYKPLGGTSFKIIDNDGTDAVSGTFAGLAEGDTLVVGTTTFKISYIGGDGNDVVLTTPVVPAAPATGISGMGANVVVILVFTIALSGICLQLSRNV